MKIEVQNPRGITICDFPWTFRCPSKSSPGATRFVDWASMKCDCPAGRHKKPCHHVRWVDDYCRLIWRQAIHRMTQTDGGTALLKEIRNFIEQ